MKQSINQVAEIDVIIIASHRGLMFLVLLIHWREGSKVHLEVLIIHDYVGGIIHKIKFYVPKQFVGVLKFQYEELDMELDKKNLIWNSS